MNIGELIYDLQPDVKSLIRKIEKFENKLIHAKIDLVFNTVCLNENILPIYTNIRTHDPAARNEAFTLEYRKQLVNRQINLRQNESENLQHELDVLWTEFNRRVEDGQNKRNITSTLDDIKQNAERIKRNTITKKLGRLYGACITLPHHTDSYINLSHHHLSKDEKEVLNLGLNCHLQTKFSKLKKKVELEILHESIIKLTSESKVTRTNDLKDLLRAEATKQRSNKNSSLLTHRQRQVAKDLLNNPNITIRRADKSNIYTILDKDQYLDKLNTILNDETKFKRITRDPTETLKNEVNKLIDASNADTDHTQLHKIIGEYSPGYIYGNVKTHKQNNPLRPIISQVTTPSYRLAKQLN